MSVHVEQIKARIAISSIISKKVILKSRAAGEHVGLCPFHHEKTPSFTVSDNRAFYHCFGCNAHGDIFTFLMESDGYDYKTALHYLAELAGVELPTYDKEQKSTHQVFYNILEKITAIYQANIHTRFGVEALHYIRQRGISDEVIAKYRLGFAMPDKASLFNELKKFFSVHEIRNTNILTSHSDNELIDPMRGRLVFPISDKAGKVIAFGGRVLGNFMPKYLNSSENPLFEKRKTLYGLYHAQSAVHKTKEVIVVEGYMDVLALANIGVQNVVAPLGTSLKVEQIESLWHVVDKPIICMDADEAGQKATMRVATEILPLISATKNIKFIQLQGGKDPDEVIQAKGAAFAMRIFQKHIELSEFLLGFYKKQIGQNTPESKALLRKKLDDVAMKVQDKSLQNEYKYFFRNELFKSSKGASASINNLKQITASLLIKDNHHLATAFYILLKNRELLSDQEVYEEIIRIELDNEELDQLRQTVLDSEVVSAESESKLQDALAQLREVERIVTPQIKTTSPKQILMRALELHSIYIVQQQIKHTEQELVLNGSESAFARLMSLKKCESDLKKKLNII